jgi:2-polyprenyl-3-methyl-5-hydroxy-6-metoxy-1,4-benzoquinol methylase
MALDDTPEKLYEAHEKYKGTGKGLMIGDEWRYTGRIGVARGILACLKPKTTLDVGCGYGCISESLPLTDSYVGLDYTQWIVEEARRRYPNRTFVHGKFGQYALNMAFDMVAAMGVLATVASEEAPALVDLLRLHSERHVMVSYLDADCYDGRLYSYHLADLNGLFQSEPVVGPVWSPDDALNKTVVYEV